MSYSPRRIIEYILCVFQSVEHVLGKLLSDDHINGLCVFARCMDLRFHCFGCHANFPRSVVVVLVMLARSGRRNPNGGNPNKGMVNFFVMENVSMFLCSI